MIIRKLLIEPSNLSNYIKQGKKCLKGCSFFPFFKKAKFPLFLGDHIEFKDIHSVQCGRKVFIGDYVVFGKDINIGSGISIGMRTYIDNQVTLLDRVSVSRNCSFLTRTHKINGNARRAGEIYFVSPLEIGEGAWIGTNVVVLPQISRIGAYSIVGAGSVVTKNVPDNVILAGNPAKVIRKLEPLEMKDKT